MAVKNNPLKTYLREMLSASGPITFEQYMSICLYHPEHGYYMKGTDRSGRQGDYFTSPDLHPIFARLIARQAAEMWEKLGKPARFTWIEMGAGRGMFAMDFLGWVGKALPDFFQALEYVAIEPAPGRRARLLDKLGELLPLEVFRNRVRVDADLGTLAPATGCFFSNELVDAFPVHVITRSRGRLREIYVGLEDSEFREVCGAISNPAIAAYVARYAKQLEEGERVEVNLKAIQWLRSVAEKLALGFALTIDYGDIAERLFSSECPAGTLMAYHHHVASENYYDAPGEQDLTAHVNLSALIDTGTSVGLELTGYTTQERFLLALGEGNEFADLYEAGQSEAQRFQSRLQLKRLIFPGGMGNVFKVLIQHRGVEAPQLIGLKHALSCKL